MSPWNDYVFPGEPLRLNCTNSSCHSASTNDSCTLVTNGHVALVGESCNTSHKIICTLVRENKCFQKQCHSEYLIILAAVSGLILLTTLVVVIWLLAYRMSKKRRRSLKVSSPSTVTSVSHPPRHPANGPLDRWLHHMSRGGRILDWAMRMNIVTTLAQGIVFLHDKVKPHVVHWDICASNVLLDEEFGAHLMGVGLSKFVSWEVMHERTKMAGTYGYLAPEFMYRNELTTKSDVYSFGVLLLEIVSGRQPAHAVESVGWQSIFEWATPLVQSHRYVGLLDPLISDIPEVGVIQKVVDLVCSCTQHVPSVRLRMSHVVHQLQQLGLRAATVSEQQAVRGMSTSATSPVLPLQVEVGF